MNVALQALSFIFLLPSTYYILVFVIISLMYYNAWYKWAAATLQVTVIVAWVLWIRWACYG